MDKVGEIENIRYWACFIMEISRNIRNIGLIFRNLSRAPPSRRSEMAALWEWEAKRGTWKRYDAAESAQLSAAAKSEGSVDRADTKVTPSFDLSGTAP